MSENGELYDENDFLVNTFKKNYKSYLDRMDSILSPQEDDSISVIIGKIESLINGINIDLTQRKELFDSTLKQKTVNEQKSLKKIKQFLNHRLSLLEGQLEDEQEELVYDYLEETNEPFDYEKTMKEIKDYLNIKHTYIDSTEKRIVSKKNNFRLKDLFENEAKYKSVVSILIENNVIARKDNCFKWVYVSPFSEIQNTMALIVALHVQEYFKLKPKNVPEYIKSEWGIEMHKSNITRVYNVFLSDYKIENTNANRCTSPFIKIL